MPPIAVLAPLRPVSADEDLKLAGQGLTRRLMRELAEYVGEIEIDSAKCNDPQWRRRDAPRPRSDRASPGDRLAAAQASRGRQGRAMRPYRQGRPTPLLETFSRGGSRKPKTPDTFRPCLRPPRLLIPSPTCRRVPGRRRPTSYVRSASTSSRPP